MAHPGLTRSFASQFAIYIEYFQMVHKRTILFIFARIYNDISAYVLVYQQLFVFNVHLRNPKLSLESSADNESAS